MSDIHPTLYISATEKNTLVFYYKIMNIRKQQIKKYV